MDYKLAHDRGAPDDRVFGLAASPEGYQCRRADRRRIRRMELGNPGDAKSVGNGVMEMRIAYRAGYRVYYVHRGALIVILLCGGDKRTQWQDIKQAQALAERQ